MTARHAGGTPLVKVKRARRHGAGKGTSVATDLDRIRTVGTVDLVEPETDQRTRPAAPRRAGEEDGLGCLETGRGNLPLDTIDVEAAVTGLASSIRLTQGFHNPYDEPLEATYIFPLPPRAAVTGLRMEAADRAV